MRTRCARDWVGITPDPAIRQHPPRNIIAEALAQRWIIDVVRGCEEAKQIVAMGPFVAGADAPNACNSAEQIAPFGIVDRITAVEGRRRRGQPLPLRMVGIAGDGAIGIIDRGDLTGLKS